MNEATVIYVHQEQAFFEKLLKIHDKYYPDSPFLFPGNTETGCLSCDAIEAYHQRSCGKLNIPISMEFKRGPHAFRRTRITEVVNNTGGNVVLAAQMYGNSPETIRKNYYTGDALENPNHRLSRWFYCLPLRQTGHSALQKIPSFISINE